MTPPERAVAPQSVEQAKVRDARSALVAMLDDDWDGEDIVEALDAVEIAVIQREQAIAATAVDGLLQRARAACGAFYDTTHGADPNGQRDRWLTIYSTMAELDEASRALASPPPSSAPVVEFDPDCHDCHGGGGWLDDGGGWVTCQRCSAPNIEELK